MKPKMPFSRGSRARNFVAFVIGVVFAATSLSISPPAIAAAGDQGSIQLSSGSYLQVTDATNQLVPSATWTIEGYIKLDVTGNQKYVLRGYSGVGGTTKAIEIYNGPASYWAMYGIDSGRQTNFTGLMQGNTETSRWLRFVFQQDGSKACGITQYTNQNPTSNASWTGATGWGCTGDTSTNTVANRTARLTSNSPITKWVIGSNEPGQPLTAKMANVRISNIARYSSASTLAFPTNYSSPDDNTLLLLGTDGDAGNYLDASLNSTVTKSGTVEVSTEHPYLNSATYSATFNGNGSTSGSMNAQSSNAAGLLDQNAFAKTGYRFVSWNTFANGTGTAYSNGGAFPFTANRTLYAQWALDSLNVTYSSAGGVLIASNTYTPGDNALVLPTPQRQGYIFDGWFTDAVSGTLVGLGGQSYTPIADTTLHAHWTQASLAGLTNPTPFGTITATAGNDGGISASRAGTRVSVDYFADSLPSGTIITAYLQGSTANAVQTLGNDRNVLLSIVVAWLAPDGSVPLVDASKNAVRVTIANPNIRAGASIYSIIGNTSTLLGTAQVDGQAVLDIREDPEIAVVNPNVNVSTGSTAFDGGSVLSYPSSDSFSLTGDYTVEFWTKFATYPRSGNMMVSRWKSGSEEYSMSSAGSQWRWSQKTTTGEVIVNFSRPAALHTWHHIAAVRSGNNLVVYVDGVSAGNATFTGSVKTGISSPLDIGGLTNANGGYFDYNNFTGRLSNVRISKTALYTAAFTPSSSSLIADASTTLLLNMAEGADFTKDTSNNAIATIVGNPTSQLDVPFTLSVPAPPAQARGTSFTGTTSVITWIASPNIAGQGNNVYTVYQSIDGLTYSTTAGCIDVSGTSCTATGLQMARGYLFKVRAKNAAGYSDFSLLEASTTGYIRIDGSLSTCASVTFLGSQSCGPMANRQPYTTAIMPTPVYCNKIDGVVMTNFQTMPVGVFDADGNMYFPVGNTIRKLAPAGWAAAPNCVTTLFSNSALLKSPFGRSIGIDAAGNIYVGNSDSVDHSVIKISPDGLTAETYLTTAQTVDVLYGIKFDSDQNLVGYQNPYQSVARLVRFANITKTKSYILELTNQVMPAIGGNKSITGFSLNAFDDIALSMVAGGQDYLIKFDHTFTQPGAVTCVGACTTEQNNQNKANLIYDASGTLFPDFYPSTVKFFAKFEEYIWSQATAIDSEGNTWIPQQLDRKLLKLDPSGKAILSTESGTIFDGGNNFYDSVGIDPSGNVFVGVTNGTQAWLKFTGATKPFLRQLTYKGIGSTPYRTAKTAQIQLDGATGSVTFKTTNSGSISVSSSGAVTASNSLEPGKYTVSGTALDSANTAGTWSYTLTVNKALPTVALVTTPNPSVVQNSVTLTATPSEFDSGTSIAFYNGATLLGSCLVTSVSCSITSSAIASGTHSLTAVTAESAHYLSATSAAASQVVGKITTGLAWSASATPTQGQPITLSAMLTPQAATGTVVFKDASTNVLCTTGNLVAGWASCVWTGNPTRGTYSVTATYNGDANYSITASSAGNVIINANQAPISWNVQNTSGAYGSTITLAISGGSGAGAVTYQKSQTSSCSVSGNVVTLASVGTTCSISATKAADDGYLAVSTSANIELTATQAAQAAVSYSGSTTFAAGANAVLRANGGSGTGAYRFTVTGQGTSGCSIANGNQLTAPTAGTCTISFGREASTNYLTSVSITQVLTVSLVNQDISFTSNVPTQPNVGGTYLVTASANSLLPVVISVLSGPCTIVAAEVSFTAVGNCVVAADQSGNATFAAASQATQTIAIGLRNQSLDFKAATDSIQTKTFGDLAFLVEATSSESTAVLVYSLSSTTNNACSVSARGLVTILAVGICAVDVNASGSGSFAVASTITKTITVNSDFAGAPTIGSLSAGNLSATVGFYLPGYNGGTAITGYQVVAVDQTAGSTIQIVESACSVTVSNSLLTCKVTGLQNGTVYKLKVAAINAAGVGAYSNLSGSLTIATNPSAVQNLTITEGNSSLAVSWADPDSLGGGTFTAYRIFIKRSDALSYDQSHFYEVTNQAVHNLVVTRESPSDGGGFAGGPAFVNGVAYDVKVVTVTSANLLELAGNTAVVNQIPHTVPDAPSLANTIILGGQLVVTWAPPSSNGGKSITAYTVTVANSVCVLVNPLDLQCETALPTSPGNYSFEIRAVNSAGSSAPTIALFHVAAIAPLSSTNQEPPTLEKAAEIFSVALATDGKSATIQGKGLAKTKGIYFGAKWVTLLSKDDATILLSSTGLESGTYDLMVMFEDGSILRVEKALVIAGNPVSQPKVSKLVTSGFSKGSSTLSAKNRLAIERFLKATKGIKSIECIGATEGPTVLKVDATLAMQRGARVCSIAKKMGYKVRSVSYVNRSQVGAKYRSVELRVNRAGQ